MITLRSVHVAVPGRCRTPDRAYPSLICRCHGNASRRAVLIGLTSVAVQVQTQQAALALPLAPLGKVLTDSDKLDKPDLETVKDILAADLRDRQYFVTGQLTRAIFSDTCRFVDPTNDIVGLSRYITALDLLFDPAQSRVELLDIKITGPNTIEAEWTLGGELKFPWRPKVATFTGRCVYTIDEETGLIREQAQTWSKSAFEALRESFTPGFL